MFVTPAYAQAAGGASPQSMISTFAMFGLIFVIMYFLMIRPQQKRVKEHRAMVEALKKGDEVVTQGGLVGKVTSVRDTELEVEIAPGVKVRVIRSTITGVVNRTQPAAANT
ncbi:protein translocase subunit yajC [Paracoccus halophilus]|uniref:Sec translocon accessory complex subunit YajC n=1 Tax=Paracoccus halophilus TaxID=376733 RepID=A0A099F1P4_9RHOB|nr:preprotein translocase subunit YajC [Paracoccus halophilus]KGJ04171.1 preprotein translocase subunit YajC [Paracoccus halophilus]SFA55591.1 protein translocase subunit yajC [Paracoccus halophilus]